MAETKKTLQRECSRLARKVADLSDDLESLTERVNAASDEPAQPTKKKPEKAKPEKKKTESIFAESDDPDEEEEEVEGDGD